MSVERSDAPPRRRRDSGATKERILVAALEEFTARGFAGARVESVAARADVNVRALYQHFGGKEQLYEAVFGDSFQKKHTAVLAAIEAVAEGRDSAGELVRAFHHLLADSLAFVRLVTWDALSVDMDAPGTNVVASGVRASMYAEEIRIIQKAQRAGHLPADLDPDLLLVTMMGLAIYPAALRPLTKIITGQVPESTEFRDRYDSFLDHLGDLLFTNRPSGVRSDRPSGVRSEAAARDRLLRVAARALAREGLVDAFGHCSLRIDESSFLVTPSVPLGQLQDGPGVTVPTRGPLPVGVAGEVRMHQAIYRRRPDVGGIVRVLPSAVGALSVLGRTARPLDRNGAYFFPGPPLWPDPGLVRDDERADQVAQALGGSAAIVLRGNGAVVAGPSLPRAVVLARFLEDASATDLAVRAANGAPIEFTADEAAARAVFSGGIEERMWRHLTRDDPENQEAGDDAAR
ncbi:class II aldolase/adducin family protein [Pseudonocardia kujensis]|uniref:class II aldolase/adducin family protein n=1 Tax=Pseudonocardia kujensis TaxID=1128675 RepID=UPI001E4EF6C3|nr:class II aldolase/adducin family protein [Pseudonocardia kujensis]MCE0767741.1 class II aldolase/adducin family protein [Pseudonocardia kujensis]